MRKLNRKKRDSDKCNHKKLLILSSNKSSSTRYITKYINIFISYVILSPLSMNTMDYINDISFLMLVIRQTAKTIDVFSLILFFFFWVLLHNRKFFNDIISFYSPRYFDFSAVSFFLFDIFNNNKKKRKRIIIENNIERFSFSVCYIIIILLIFFLYGLFTLCVNRKRLIS